jgi:hypothetical protein
MSTEMERCNDAIHRAQVLIELIAPLLNGQGPQVQGLTLVELTATWLAGHHPELRPTVLSQFMQTLVKLIPENEREIFGDRGFPTEGL